jgi:murein DD-endopeptidase MepM/ murein hydrolase activator NlpD
MGAPSGLAPERGPVGRLDKPVRRRRLTGAAARLLRALPPLALVWACHGSGPTAPEATCGPWPNQESSPYVLPYRAGEAYPVSQGNCTNRTHILGTRDQYAYDFRMPIGTTVIAARSGVVGEIEERFEDGNSVITEVNYVLLRHGDGTASVYFHLTQNGVLVELGQSVEQGQVIALSGQTGGNGIQPHLHFGVLGANGMTIPVTFRNTIPHPNSLQVGVVYPAF